MVVGQFADTDEAFLAGHDLHEGTEAHDPGDLAHVQGTHLDLTGQAVDPVDGLAGVVAGNGRDLDRAVVLDVDLRRRFFLDLSDHRPTLADDLADLLGVDLDRRDTRREVAHVRACLGHDLGHLVQDLQAGRQSLLQAAADDRLVDTLDLDVHLQGGDAVPCSGHLEVHVADRVLFSEDVGQDDEPAIRFADQAHRRAGNRRLDRHARVHQGERRAARGGHRCRAVGGQALRHESDDIGELIMARQDRDERPLGQIAMPDITPAGPAHRLVLARGIRWEVVVVEVALLCPGADRIDPLDVG